MVRPFLKPQDGIFASGVSTSGQGFTRVIGLRRPGGFKGFWGLEVLGFGGFGFLCFLGVWGLRKTLGFAGLGVAHLRFQDRWLVAEAVKGPSASLEEVMLLRLQDNLGWITLHPESLKTL